MLKRLLAIIPIFLCVVFVLPASAMSEDDVGYYLLFTRDSQIAVGDIPRSRRGSIQAASGTVINVRKDVVSIVTGSGTIFSGDRTVIVQGRSGRLGVQPNTEIEFNVSGTDESFKELPANYRHQESPNSGSPSRLVARSTSQFSVASNKVNITRGSVLMNVPDKQTIIETPGGTIKFPHGGIAAVRMINNTLCLENCSALDPVKFTVRGATLIVNPGCECILKRGRPLPTNVPSDKIFRRNYTAKFDGFVSAIICEFEPCSLVRSEPAFRRAILQPISQRERSFADTYVKNATVLSLGTASHETFGPPPRVMHVKELGAVHDSLAEVKQPVLN